MKSQALERISRPSTEKAVLRLVPSLVKHPAAKPERVCPAQLYLAGLSPSGRRAQVSKLQAIARLMGLQPTEIRWKGLRFAICIVLRELLVERGYQPATVNAMLSALRGVARAAWQLKLMKAEDYQRIREIKSVKGTRLAAGRALSPGEVEKLFRACHLDPTPAGARDAALVATLRACGLRRSECVGTLSLADYARADCTLRVRGKGDRERLAYLGSVTARRALERWLLVRGNDQGPLFCPVTKAGHVVLRALSDQAVYLALKRRAKAARIGHCTPHDLRRTFVTELLDDGADMATVQELAGHASLSTTKIYDRRGERHLRQAAQTVSFSGARRRPK